MESALIILKQLAIMAIYCLVGATLHKAKLVSKEGCRAFSKLLLYVILPCVIVQSFLREAKPEITKALATCGGVSVLLLAIAIGISRLFLSRDPIAMFSASFSNAGFMGIPLITMAYGSNEVLYIAPFVALVNILQWTYGQSLLLGKRQGTPLEILRNPLVLSLIFGVAVYVLPFSVPDILQKPISALASCNGPIAMIILGYYLAEVPFRQIVCTPSAWLVSVLRLLVIPALSVLAVAWLPAVSAAAKTALIIAASAPVGINVAIYAELLGKDYQKAVAMICNSSIMSLLTLPLMIFLSNILITG